MLVTIRNVMFALTKAIGALGLGGVILWQVAAHSGAQIGLARVHASPDVDEVAVDDLAYHVETIWDSPVVFELRPGRHKLQMFRDGEVVYKQEFTLGMGEEIVLVGGAYPLRRSSVFSDSIPPELRHDRSDRGCGP